jgi:HPt (histidine-containing phosphotransfer) domain-containing protein
MEPSWYATIITPPATTVPVFSPFASEFADWMIKECDRLDAARAGIRQNGFNKATTAELFHAAHDLKGDAATFGYPLTAPAARSLCMLLEHSPEHDRIPLLLIDQHVDAVRAIVREYDRPDIEQIATALTMRLTEVSQDFLIRENRHRPGYLDGLFDAPLVPDGA